MRSKVFILDYGTNVTDYSDLVAGEGAGKRLKIPCIGILIVHPNGNVLVDTGVHDLTSKAAKNWEHVQSKDQTPMQQIKKLGLTPEDIDQVVLTHLHWDHCGNTHFFPNANVFVRREEMEKAFVPLKKDEIVYHRPDFDRKLNYEIIPNGLDFELLNGIKLISSPGHSAGLQAIMVETGDGSVLYASDAIYTYKNWEEKLIPGICFSSELHVQSISKLRALRADHIIPSHDPELDLTKTYG